MSRLEAAFKRLGITYNPDSPPSKSFPRLSLEQVRRLQEMFPVRLLEPGEDVDAYRHYCGAAALVQELRYALDAGLAEGDDEDEVLTAEAVGRGIAAYHGVPYKED